MTKTTHQPHWDSYCENEPVSICASAVYVLSVCLYMLEKLQRVDFQSPEHLQLKPHSPCTVAHSFPAPPLLILSLFGYFPVWFWVVFILALFVFAFPCCAASLSYVGMSSHILATVASCDAETCVRFFLIIDIAVFSSTEEEVSEFKITHINFCL